MQIIISFRTLITHVLVNESLWDLHRQFGNFGEKVLVYDTSFIYSVLVIELLEQVLYIGEPYYERFPF